MLQDLEAGRVMETDALLGSVLELAHMTETSTPTLEAVYALLKLLGRPLETGGREAAMTAAVSVRQA